MLEVRAVRKAYGSVQAIDSLSLSVAPGEIAGLIGHNGAGKSTLVGVISGLIRPDAGSVVVDGLDVARSARQVRARLGVAPQEEALYLPMTVREHLELFAMLGGLRGRAVERAVARTAEEMVLGPVLDRRVGILSGGQRRRTQTATALVHSPPVLLLDEPTVGADPETRSALLAAVRARADDGAAVLYATHYLPELHDLDASVALVVAGRVVSRGSRRSLVAGLPGRLRLTLRDSPSAGEVSRMQGMIDSLVVDGREVVVEAVEPGRLLAKLVPVVAASLVEVSVEDASLDDLSRAAREVVHVSG